MAEVAKKAGTVAHTGAWVLPVGKADHQRAVRGRRRSDRGAVRELRREFDRGRV